MPAFLNAQALLIGIVLVIAGSTKMAGKQTLIVARQSALTLLVRSTTRLVVLWRVIGVAEFVVGLFVLVLPDQYWPRTIAAFLLSGACVYLAWSRRMAPQRPCGCFGAASISPPNWRGSARAAMLLGIAIVVAIASTPWVTAIETPPGWLLTAVEAAVLICLSPEIDQLRLRHRRLHVRSGKGDCSATSVPLETSLGRLKASDSWRALRPHIIDQTLREYWNESCVRFLDFAAIYAGQPVTAIFAVPLEPDNVRVYGALVDESSQQVLLGTDSLV